MELADEFADEFAEEFTVELADDKLRWSAGLPGESEPKPAWRADAGPIAVRPVDHADACAHEAGQVVDRDSRSEGFGCERVAKLMGMNT